MTLRIVFMGTPDFSVPTLMEIIGQGHEVAAVYTQPPRPAGRGMAERRSPVHDKAEAFGIAVRTPKSLRGPDEQVLFAALQADLAVVVAYGLILPKPVLDAPRLGCLNLHASLLPRWRGAAPIQRAIMAGDRETGVMVMRMEEGLDTGPVCMAERTAIATRDTAGTIHDRLAGLGADLMVRALTAAEHDALTCRAQPAEGVTYASKIDNAEARIDWRKPADAIISHIHGLSPFPGAWMELRVGGAIQRVKVLHARIGLFPGDPGSILNIGSLVVGCGARSVRIEEVQPAGKRIMTADEFRRGLRGSPEVVL